jgi:hypothetical protein
MEGLWAAFLAVSKSCFLPVYQWAKTYICLDEI